jgi:carboxylesterase
MGKDVSMSQRELHNRPVLLEGGEHACLLLHGFGGGAYELLWLAEDLHRAGLTVQTLNYPGHDVKADIMPVCTWEEWYAHVREAYRGLRDRASRVSIVGLSTGCPLALQLALDEPVDRLVLISPFLALKRQWFHLLPLETFAPLVEKLQPIIRRQGPDIRNSAMARFAWQYTHLTTFRVSALRSALALIRQLKPRLPEITSPTLIFQSSSDEVVDPSGARLLMKNLGSTKKEVHWLSRSNHVLTLDYEMDFVTEKTLDFLLGNSL